MSAKGVQWKRGWNCNIIFHPPSSSWAIRGICAIVSPATPSTAQNFSLSRMSLRDFDFKSTFRDGRNECWVLLQWAQKPRDVSGYIILAPHANIAFNPQNRFVLPCWAIPSRQKLVEWEIPLNAIVIEKEMWRIFIIHPPLAFVHIVRSNNSNADTLSCTFAIHMILLIFYCINISAYRSHLSLPQLLSQLCGTFKCIRGSLSRWKNWWNVSLENFKDIYVDTMKFIGKN